MAFLSNSSTSAQYRQNVCPYRRRRRRRRRCRRLHHLEIRIPKFGIRAPTARTDPNFKVRNANFKIWNPNLQKDRKSELWHRDSCAPSWFASELVSRTRTIHKFGCKSSCFACKHGLELQSAKIRTLEFGFPNTGVRTAIAFVARLRTLKFVRKNSKNPKFKRSDIRTFEFGYRNSKFGNTDSKKNCKV